MDFRACENCGLKAVGKCSCNDKYYCANDFISHSKQGMSHGFIDLINSLDSLSFRHLVSEIQSRISLIMSSKANITSKATTIVKLIIQQSSSSIHCLDSMIQHYLEIIKTNRYDEDSFKEVENILKTKIVQQDHSVYHIEEEIRQFFSNPFVFDKNDEALRQIEGKEREKCAELESEKERIIAEQRNNIHSLKIQIQELKERLSIKMESEREKLEVLNEQGADWSQKERYSVFEERKKSIEEINSVPRTNSQFLSYECFIGKYYLDNSSKLQEKISYCKGIGLKGFKEKILEASRVKIKDIKFTPDNNFVFICDYHSDCKLHAGKINLVSEIKIGKRY
jgi:hypothetical protein